MKVNSEGVSSSMVYLPAGQNHACLLDFFIVTFPHIDRGEWEARFEEGLVFTQEGEALGAGDAYLPNTHLLYYRRLAREPEVPYQEHILFQDEHILVADKPHFLPVTPSGLYLHQTLLNRLKKKTGIVVNEYGEKVDTQETEEKISLLPYDISNANSDLLKISKENKNVKK